MLHRLPGRKIVFSNGPRHYTEAILAHTGIADCFAALYSLERVRFRPKPHPSGFHQLLRQEKANPRHCIMVEDSLANLATAKRLGMKTVWINPGARLRRPPYVDAALDSVLELPRWLGRL